VALLGAALWFCTLASQLHAVEVHGNAQVFGGTTDVDDVETDVVQQDYRVSFFQSFTPWLSVNMNYRYGKDRNSGVDVVERSRSAPEISLLYSRPTFTARLNYVEQRTDGTMPTDNLELSSALAYVSWKPQKGPHYVLQYREDSNFADVALFGRDSDSSALQFDTVYDSTDWSVRFSHQDSAIDNNRTGFQFDQTRDQLRVNYQHRWQEGRYTLAAETRISQVNQDQFAPTGSTLAQPVIALVGLFSIDLTPDFGTLNLSAALVDGDTETPIVPTIEIGGANTGRNIGVDLGVTRQVTRLEISVDSLSDASLQWDVYHSPDNFNCTILGGITSEYDEAFDRYTLHFPETTDRYFKAVNVSVNAFANVAVTEIRALQDIDEFGRSEAKSDTFRVDVHSSLQPHRDVRGRLHLFVGNDEDIAGGRVSQGVDQLAFDTGWTFDLGNDLRANVDFLYTEFEQEVAPAQRRELEQYGASLLWDPPETVKGLFEVTRRDESDRGGGVRSTDSVRIRVATQIYTSLSVTSELSQTDVDDYAGGFTQSVLRWSETLESNPTRTWRVGGSSTVSWFDSQGIDTVSRRVGVELFNNWRIVPYLTLSMILGYNEDDRSENLHQRYTLSWAPGRKLAASLYFQDSDAMDTRKVTSGGGSASYRLNRKLSLFANVSRSKTAGTGFLTTKTTSGRLGFRATF